MKGMGDLQELLQMGQKMQARMKEVRERLSELEVTASSGGGMVEVTADGEGRVKAVRLDPAAVDPEDVEMLEDLIVAAVSEAQRRAEEKREEELEDVAGGLPLDGLPGGLSGLLG